MTLDQNQLDKLCTLGETFFSVQQCALVLEVDQLELKKEIKLQTSAAHKAYYKGLLTATLKLRQSIMDLAMRGSSPAQTQMLKILEQTINNNG